METQYYTEATNAGITYQNTIIEESAGIAALGAVLWGASKGLSTNPTMPRRQFLGNAIGVTAGIMATGSLLRLETPYIANVKDEPTKDFLETVANVVRPRIARSLIIDGRTAMLLAKAEDVQAILPELSQAVNVVVMGNQHLDMVPTEQDKGERNKAIAAYAEELLASAQQVYADYFHILPEHIPPQVINSVLNYVSQVDIVEVTDPGGPTIQPNFPQTVDKQITPYKSFHSPQVEEAIKPLRPQQ
jgi:hypothetical protein